MVVYSNSGLPRCLDVCFVVQLSTVIRDLVSALVRVLPGSCKTVDSPYSDRIHHGQAVDSFGCVSHVDLSWPISKVCLDIRLHFGRPGHLTHLLGDIRQTGSMVIMEA